MPTANVTPIRECHEQLSLLKKAGYCAKYVELAFTGFAVRLSAHGEALTAGVEMPVLNGAMGANSTHHSARLILSSRQSF